jgi:hypothetical protein
MSIDPRIIARLITEDPDHFNEVYAKHLINEIVDPGNTDLGDIEVEEEDRHGSLNTTYTFSDPRHKYMQYGDSYDMGYIVSFKSRLVGSDQDYQNVGQGFEEQIPLGARVVNIDLESESKGYNKTKKGNFAFVYSRLMTCVVDYFHNKGNDPMFVQFKGYSKDMDSVYLKIMDRLSKKYPDRGYYPFKYGAFISKSAVSNIEDDTVKMRLLDAIENQSKLLKSGIADYKSEKRRIAAARGNEYNADEDEDEDEDDYDDDYVETPEEQAATLRGLLSMMPPVPGSPHERMALSILPPEPGSAHEQFLLNYRPVPGSAHEQWLNSRQQSR